jgi:hypothetical protein
MVVHSEASTASTITQCNTLLATQSRGPKPPSPARRLASSDPRLSALTALSVGGPRLPRFFFVVLPSALCPLVNMEIKSPKQNYIERFRMKSLTNSAFTFALHQLIGMWGIPNTAPLVFSLAFNLPFLFGHSYPQRTFYSIVSERPYFPVQIIFGFILGWLLGRTLRHRSMVWVWVLPLAILVYSLATATTLTPEWTSVLAKPGVGQSRFSHYFGWGCRPAERCLDQMLITMPFYSSLAYSAGAVLARKTLGYAYSQNREHLRAVTLAGLVVLAAFAVDLAVSIQKSGWHTGYLWFALTPVGLGALLLYIGSAMSRQPSTA